MPKIEFKVYFTVALYPEGVFDSDKWDDDEYDFAADREEKLNTYAVTDDKVPHIIKLMTDGCNWSKDEYEYITKVCYEGDGIFIAYICFTDLDQEEIDDDFVVEQILRTTLWPGNDDIYLTIDNTVYEFDLEIEGSEYWKIEDISSANSGTNTNINTNGSNLSNEEDEDCSEMNVDLDEEVLEEEYD